MLCLEGWLGLYWVALANYPQLWLKGNRMLAIWRSSEEVFPHASMVAWAFNAKTSSPPPNMEPIISVSF